MLTLLGQRPVQVLASFLNTSFTEEQATTKRVCKPHPGFLVCAQDQEVISMKNHIFVKSLVQSMEQFGQLLNCVGQL